MRLIANVPKTPADWAAIEAANLTEPPNCPMVGRYFSCVGDGTLDVINVTLPTTDDGASLAFGWPRHIPVRRIFVDNLVGSFGGLNRLEATESLEMRNSVLLGINPIVNDTLFLFDVPSLVLTNVSLVRIAFPSNAAARFRECRFVNVTLRCPVPQWLWRCFDNNTEAPPCETAEPPRLPLPRLQCSGLCEELCATPPAPDYSCGGRNDYFPSISGQNVIEHAFNFIGEAEQLSVYTRGTIGIVTRVELWNWRELNWTVAIDRPMPVRRIEYTAENEERLLLPPILTNRVRFTVEQHYAPRDVISRVYFIRSAWPVRAAPVRVVPTECGPVQTLGSRSMRDETVADSLCVGRVCQFACAVSPIAFAFDRVVAARYLVVQGGDLWTGPGSGTLNASLSHSDGTRIYQLNGTATRTVNVTGVGDALRVRLVGDPLPGESLPTVSNPSRLGLPGIFVKSARSRVPSGAALARTAAGAFDGRAAAPPFALDASTAIATVLNSTFALTIDGQLWRFDGQWRAVDGKVELSRIKRNRNESEPMRSIVAVGASLLAVVVASSELHDGTSDQLLINRWLVQTPIDVFDVAASRWFVGLMQHDIAKNMSDIDVVRWNATHFAVVDRATEAATLFQFTAFDYELQPCAANTNCASCLANEANIEPCRWCSSRCASICALGETSTLNVTQCAATINETASENNATTGSSNTTPTAQPATPAPLRIDTTALTRSGLSSSGTIGLAVGLPLVLLTLVGVGVGAWVLWRRRRSTEASTTADAHLSALPSAQDAASSYDDIVDVRETLQ